jgi:hypothetical protein
MTTGLKHLQRNYDDRIDKALRRLGSTEPAPGMEDRIAARLARERAGARDARRSRFFAVPRFVPRFAFGIAAAALACVAIVAGSVNHSHRIQPAMPGIELHPGSSGMGAANASRPADRPVSPTAAERPRSVRQLPEGRAVISPQSQKPTGVTVPKNPPPATTQP